MEIPLWVSLLGRDKNTTSCRTRQEYHVMGDRTRVCGLTQGQPIYSHITHVKSQANLILLFRNLNSCKLRSLLFKPKLVSNLSFGGSDEQVKGPRTDWCLRMPKASPTPMTLLSWGSDGIHTGFLGKEWLQTSSGSQSPTLVFNLLRVLIPFKTRDYYWVTLIGHFLSLSFNSQTFIEHLLYTRAYWDTGETQIQKKHNLGFEGHPV